MKMKFIVSLIGFSMMSTTSGASPANLSGVDLLPNMKQNRFDGDGCADRNRCECQANWNGNGWDAVYYRKGEYKGTNGYYYPTKVEANAACAEYIVTQPDCYK